MTGRGPGYWHANGTLDLVPSAIGPPLVGAGRRPGRHVGWTVSRVRTLAPRAGGLLGCAPGRWWTGYVPEPGVAWFLIFAGPTTDVSAAGAAASRTTDVRQARADALSGPQVLQHDGGGSPNTIKNLDTVKYGVKRGRPDPC